MVSAHLGFLHGECQSMIQGERRADLRNMYPLLSAVPSGLPPMVHHMMEHIKQQGLRAISPLASENVSIFFTLNILFYFLK